MVALVVPRDRGHHEGGGVSPTVILSGGSKTWPFDRQQLTARLSTGEQFCTDAV
jgi:hypothetical protein